MASAAQPDDILWSKILAGNESYVSLSLVRAPDGYILAGLSYQNMVVIDNVSCMSGNDTVSTACAVKIDDDGVLLWQNDYPQSNESVFLKTLVTQGGNYIFVGTRHLVETGPDGRILWTKDYAVPGCKLGFEDAVLEPDGGVILFGYLDNQTQNGDRAAAGPYLYLLKADASGNKVWSTVLSGSDITGGDNSLQFSSIARAPDGGYAIAGKYGNSAGYKNYGYLLRLDARGNKLWDKKYLGEGNTEFVIIDNAGDDGFVLAGYTGTYLSQVYLCRVTLDGTEVWSRTLGLGYAYDVQPSGDGGFVLVTGHNVIKVDGKGADVWNRMPGKDNFEIMNSSLSNVVRAGYDVYLISGRNDIYDMFSTLLVKIGNVSATEPSPAPTGGCLPVLVLPAVLLSVVAVARLRRR